MFRYIPRRSIGMGIVRRHSRGREIFLDCRRVCCTQVLCMYEMNLDKIDYSYASQVMFWTNLYRLYCTFASSS